MRVIAFALACLASRGHGRSSAPSAQGRDAAAHRLAGLLLAFDGAAAGWHGHRLDFAVRCLAGDCARSHPAVFLDRTTSLGNRSSQRRVPQTRREVMGRGALALATAGSLAFADRLPVEAETPTLSPAEELEALQQQLAALQAQQAALTSQPAPAPAPALTPAPAVQAAPTEPVSAVPAVQTQTAPAPASKNLYTVRRGIPKMEPFAGSLLNPALEGPASPQSAYDFRVPFRNEIESITRFIGPKASIFVNIKSDDPESSSQMPELVRLHDTYASQGLHILAFPTNQGWIEPDESSVLRLKFKRDYDFGKFPSAVVFDKADLLGTKALPLYTWMTKKMPNPWNVTRIVFNYEKFLISADGQPLRRYPRRYPVELMEADVRAVLAGKELPPAFKRFDEDWEKSKREAAKSEYAFRPYINYYLTGSPGDSGAW